MWLMGQIQRVRQMRPADGTGTQSRVSEEIILFNPVLATTHGVAMQTTSIHRQIGKDE